MSDGAAAAADACSAAADAADVDEMVRPFFFLLRAAARVFFFAAEGTSAWVEAGARVRPEARPEAGEEAGEEAGSTGRARHQEARPRRLVVLVVVVDRAGEKDGG